MRRPALCSDAGAQEEDVGRVARVKRLLAGLGGRAPRPRVFGAPLQELPRGADGVPVVMARLCCYIEEHGLRCGGLFRLSAGNPKLCERLKASFDRAGDADLEGAADASTVASLLKVWLRELPEPLVTPAVAAELLDVHAKLQNESPAEWREAIRQTLSQLPETNHRSLRYLLLFLQRYEQCRHQPGLDAAFAPVLLLDQTLCARLIRDASIVCPEQSKSVDQVGFGGDIQVFTHSEPCNDPDSECNPKQRKRKERQESFSSQDHDRKVIRSNSEERPAEEHGLESKDKSIRRVSSHEDFSLVRNSCNKNKSFLTEISDPIMGHATCVRASTLPLHERNFTSKSFDVDIESFEEDEHERRRSSERFAQSAAPRGRRRTRTPHKSTRRDSDDADGGSSKENEEREATRSPLIEHLASQSSPSDEEGDSSRSSSTHSFLQLHPQERQRSPSPAHVPPTTPPLDLSTLHQEVDSSEPLTSYRDWGNEEERRAVVSPRNSLVLPRRPLLDPSIPPSPPHQHHQPGRHGHSPEAHIKRLTKRQNSLRRKLRHYEEEFLKSHGYQPSQKDKSNDKNMQKLSSKLADIKKNIKRAKEEQHAATLGIIRSTVSSGVASALERFNVEEIVHEIEKRLSDKRHEAGRSENLEELTGKQLEDEKLEMQKALLHMEKKIGRPTGRGDRELVRPLYSRYRTLKRMVERVGTIKDSGVTELATILEHETMHFTSSPPSLTSAESIPAISMNESEVLPARVQSTSSPSRTLLSDSLGANLHALPLCELLTQQRTLIEEKKQLRRAVREYEDAFQQRIGRKPQRREDYDPILDDIYIPYKEAKAKLKLVDALLSKQT